MKDQLKEAIIHTSETFGLDNYYLNRHHIFREKNNFHQTNYILNMEWIPNDADKTDEDHIPSGTTIIDMELHTKTLKRIVFTQGTSNAKEELYPSSDSESIIEWIEGITGYQYGHQFQISHQEEDAITFRAAVDNVGVIPSGKMEVELEGDMMTLFTIDGVFPSEDKIIWEPFSLTSDQVEPLAMDQCKITEVPLEEQEIWLPVYGIEKTIITNDGSRTIPVEAVEQAGVEVKLDTVLEWDEPIKEAFERAEIDLSPEVTVEQAIANEPHPDLLPITEEAQEKSTEEARRFLQREFPDESSQLKLTSLLRENGYLIANLEPVDSGNRIIERKIKLVMDDVNFNVLNYTDNNVVLEMFQFYESAEKPTISKDEAYKKLYEHIEVTPVYVYDPKIESYIMCGMIDCAYGVNAVSGEVILLKEM
ncbi:hypothetical protein ACFQ3N_11890 [Virgibacillus byunsanensis]|uniref:Uncharacterized protein n=1 Tax=Virgibacillus byunsanensis TaxID=570945 RepID=A0ABW3LP98_9BACI